MNKIALITGITGQDGAYLAEFLLDKGYEVHGIKRRSSMFNTGRIDHLYQDPHVTGRRFILHHGDMTDSSSLVRIIQEVQPDEIYNLAAQSHVAVSFEEPEYTANSDGLGTLRVLEAIRILGLETKTRFYQASTSELSTVWYKRRLKEKLHLFIHDLPMLQQSFMPTGLLLIIERLMASMPVTEFYLITKVLCVARPLLRERLQERSLELSLDFKLVCI